MKPLKIMKKIDSLSIIINFDGYSQRAKKKTSKIESDVETAVRYAKNRGRYEKNPKKYAKSLGLGRTKNQACQFSKEPTNYPKFPGFYRF